MGYIETTKELYRDAAAEPMAGLCCTTSPVWKFPGLTIPSRMLEMNYGCGTTVHPRDLAGNPTVLYVGVGGGMELLQFAYFSRKRAGVIGIDPVKEMLEASAQNLSLAAKDNGWLSPDYVLLRNGDARYLPVEDNSVDVAAQNCLFNIFESADLRTALRDIHRVLKPRGKFVLSDPIAPVPLPDHLRKDERLRAMCLTGAQTYEKYVDLLVESGFGTIEIRARRPYRVLDPKRFGIENTILLESIEVAAVKEPPPADGACVFTGRMAVYFGDADQFDDEKGHVLPRDMPVSVCDKTARNLQALGRPDLIVTDSTYFYDGGGCC